jgi:hypothetical protein
MRMARHRSTLAAGLAACLLAGCATPSASPPPAHAVAAVGKVVASLGDEVMQRLGTDRFRGVPVVVSTAGTSGSSVEPIVAEFLRTRLQEQGATVNVACAGRCMEIILQEFATNAPGVSGLTPGQVLTVATGSIPVLGSLTRSLTDREREAERAAARTTGLLVTFAAREGNTYVARSHVVAIVSTSSGEVALERK